MGATPSTAAILAESHKVLDSANNFTKSVTGGKPDAFAPKAPAKAAESKYGPVRTARKSGEFMGVNSDQGSELKAAEANRDAANKTLKD